MIKLYNAKLQQLWLAKDVFTELKALTGETYRKMNNRHTFLVTIAGQSYFVKYHYGVGWREIFKSLKQGRKPILGAINEWQAILKLQELKLSTLSLAGFGQRGRNPAKQESFLLTYALENTISLEDYCASWLQQAPKPRLKWRLIEKVATITKTLHQNGINHRDLYLCHFLLDQSLSAKDLIHKPFGLYLIDLHRTQIRTHTPQRWIIKDLSSLYFSAMHLNLSQTDLMRFLRTYTEARPKFTLLKQKRFWHKVLQKARRLYQKEFQGLA